MRISAAAKIASCGGSGGVIETEAMMEDVPLGAAGMAWTESVELSSCSVNRRSSNKRDVGGNWYNVWMPLLYMAICLGPLPAG